MPNLQSATLLYSTHATSKPTVCRSGEFSVVMQGSKCDYCISGVSVACTAQQPWPDTCYAAPRRPDTVALTNYSIHYATRHRTLHWSRYVGYDKVLRSRVTHSFAAYSDYVSQFDSIRWFTVTRWFHTIVAVCNVLFREQIFFVSDFIFRKF